MNARLMWKRRVRSKRSNVSGAEVMEVMNRLLQKNTPKRCGQTQDMFEESLPVVPRQPSTLDPLSSSGTKD